MAKTGSKSNTDISDDVPVVALGASAGGLESLKAFFSAMPPDCGMAFIVVTHRAKDGINLLPEILAKHTAMPVEEAQDHSAAKPGHVYIAPAAHYLRLFDGLMVYNEIIKDHVALPIDFFFRSLAEQRKEKGICILLSGGGSDGTLGLQAVKGEGGLAMAQDMRSAKFSDMPGNAIATGLVDFVLPPEEMPAALVQYIKNLDTKIHKESGQISEEALDEILSLIRRRTGSDFGLYKTNTLLRRIERRMNVHHLSDAWDYVRYIKDNAHEVGLLFKELLIGVTAFFRDEAAFEALEKEALPELLKNKKNGDPVRLWIAGCSTGEEAYSFAILMQEYMDTHEKQFHVQIFATDLDENAINIARAGLYSDGIGLDLSEERLERHFVKEDSHYRVRKNIREMVIFATQNLIQDPPFTKLDLVSCRNLLIYLDAATQKKIIPLFHYSLRPGGMLFLGSSETVGMFSEIFTPVHARWKIFMRKESPLSTRRLARITDLPYPPEPEHTLSAHDTKQLNEKMPSITELAQKLMLTQHVPPSLIVNECGEIFFIHGRTGLYLEPPQGQPHGKQNIFEMAREGLQLPLIAVIRKATTQDAEVLHKGIRMHGDGADHFINLRACKIVEPEALRGLIWVMLEKEDDESLLTATAPIPQENDQLESELRFVKQSLQNSIEELETANEQLKSTNEELQSTNEELQSANEELETAKEEMQSLNEELQTVNEELENKIQDLSHANDDMKNLLNNTGIATLFLDNNLNIKRFTVQAKKIINLIPADAGRPVRDIVWQLEYADLVADATEVLQTLVYKEVEVRARDWSWYLMRIMPYRTADNVIEGLVITFVDITRLKRSEILLAANIKALTMLSVDQANLTDVLDEILLTIERQTPGIWCTVSSVRDNKLHHVSAPTLPDAFNRVLDKIDMNPESGAPCIQAALRGEHVIDGDLSAQNPPTEFSMLALRYNIRAAWSQPIYGKDMRIAGVFTIYYHQAHRPSDMEEQLVNQAVPLMGIAMSRDHEEG
jgi:two-component system CheB/CheR fusion protein